MSGKYTRWFSIDKDGQPTAPGWYDTLYSWEPDDLPDHKISISYWDGEQWIWSPEFPDPLEFGNVNTKGERWRGLSKKADAAEAPENVNSELKP